mmetsp:Transcript_50592/g.120293  ORF Transcript_50592/g.120293 Transcript_50592/m.120293 type:complete len:227 (+) Transcript_50592:323-1003(+)
MAPQSHAPSALQDDGALSGPACAKSVKLVTSVSLGLQAAPHARQALTLCSLIGLASLARQVGSARHCPLSAQTAQMAGSAQAAVANARSVLLEALWIARELCVPRVLQAVSVRMPLPLSAWHVAAEDIAHREVLSAQIVQQAAATLLTKQGNVRLAPVAHSAAKVQRLALTALRDGAALRSLRFAQYVRLATTAQLQANLAPPVPLEQPAVPKQALAQLVALGNTV